MPFFMCNDDQVHLVEIKALESPGGNPLRDSVYAATSSLIPLTQKLHPSQLRSATQRFLCPVVICISNTHIHLYLCTQCLHERLLIVVFTLDLCPNENMDDSRGWGNYENLFILYISHSHMNSAVTIAGLSRVGNIALAFHDQLGGSLSTLNLHTCMRWVRWVRLYQA